MFPNQPTILVLASLAVDSSPPADPNQLRRWISLPDPNLPSNHQSKPNANWPLPRPANQAGIAGPMEGWEKYA